MSYLYCVYVYVCKWIVKKVSKNCKYYFSNQTGWNQNMCKIIRKQSNIEIKQKAFQDVIQRKTHKLCVCVCFYETNDIGLYISMENGAWTKTHWIASVKNALWFCPDFNGLSL